MHHPQLDGIRGIMAWWVVIGHLVNYFGASHLATNDILIRVLTLTSLPVDIFICISGFVIFAALSKRDPMAEYATNRFFRIYPVYFLILIVAIASEPFRLAGMQAADWVFDFGKAPHAVTEVAGLNHIAHIVLHLLLLHGAVPDQILLGSGDKFIGPAWSLSLEWQFYVIAPLLYMAGRHSLRTLLLSLLGLVATKAALYHAGLSFSYGGFLPLKIEMFSLGMMSFYFASPPPEKQGGRTLNGALLLLILAVGALYAPYNKATLLAYLAWGIISLTLLPQTRGNFHAAVLCRFMSAKPLVYIGTRSYSTYLLHLPLIQLLSFIALRYDQIPTAPTPVFMAWFSLVAISLTATLSVILYNQIENPFMRAGKNLNLKRRQRQASE
jgi:peptidoglycan/LPS O-acetylase OafA/YrhL